MYEYRDTIKEKEYILRGRTSDNKSQNTTEIKSLNLGEGGRQHVLFTESLHNTPLSSKAGMEPTRPPAAGRSWSLGFRPVTVPGTGRGIKRLFRNRPEKISPVGSGRLRSAPRPAARAGTRRRGRTPSSSPSSRSAWGRCKTTSTHGKSTRTAPAQKC